VSFLDQRAGNRRADKSGRAGNETERFIGHY
jgi:hypothetical protein